MMLLSEKTVICFPKSVSSVKIEKMVLFYMKNSIYTPFFQAIASTE